MYWIFFRHNAKIIPHIKLQYSVNITFIFSGKSTIHQQADYSLSGGHLDLSPQCPRGPPVLPPSPGGSCFPRLPGFGILTGLSWRCGQGCGHLKAQLVKAPVPGSRGAHCLQPLVLARCPYRAAHSRAGSLKEAERTSERSTNKKDVTALGPLALEVTCHHL